MPEAIMPGSPHRRDLLRLGGIAAAGWAASLAAGNGCFGQDPVVDPAGDGLSDLATETLYADDETDIAIDKAIEFLMQRQNDQGAIFDRQHPIAMTALAIMAMASVGVQPDAATPRGRSLARALDFVLADKHQDDYGFFGGHDDSRMYGHGIITLMLTEMLGMGVSVTQNVRIHASLEKAIALILKAQRINKPTVMRGGWRYSPDSPDSDLSVSVWQLMALRSAKNDGMSVPGAAIDLAIEYLRNSFTGDAVVDAASVEVQGGFSYMPGSRSATFAMTAAGLLAMQVCGQYDSPLVKAAADWLIVNPPQASERFFYYGIYYYAQGMHQVGGTHAATARRLTADLLLKDQRNEGSWEGRSGEERNIGPVYATALSVLSLSVRYHYLPIYQR